MIQDLWKRTSFYCMNHGEDHVRLYDYTGTGKPFFACPRYWAKDEEHENGHEPYEEPCMNRLDYDTAQDIVEKLSQMIDEDDKDGIVTDYKNCVIHVKGIEAKVIRYTDKEIRIGILNRRVFAK